MNNNRGGNDMDKTQKGANITKIIVAFMAMILFLSIHCIPEKTVFASDLMIGFQIQKILLLRHQRIIFPQKLAK